MAKTIVRINPPPSNLKCDRCGKVPKRRYSNGAVLMKTFRCEFRGTDNEQVGASWECADCVNEADEGDE